ncbi:MAG: glycoside hydrolase family 97 protein [Tannerella sp.]|nr:glycoside hydrolase family 97 protein [Tannerella sp.]
MNKISFFLLSCIVLLTQCNTHEPVTVKSPDGQVVFNLFSKGGQLYFNASFKGKAVLTDSPLVFYLDGEELTNSVSGKGSQTYSIDEQYFTRGIHRDAVNQCNGISIDFESGKNKIAFAVEARAYNDGIAFRVLVPGENVVRTPDEATGFKLPKGSIVWYHDMYNHYEGIHEQNEITQLKAGEWAAPPITVRLPDGSGYACITEAALLNYAGMALQADGQSGLVTRLGHAQPAGYPFAHDYNLSLAQELSIAATVTGDITTPWRTVIIVSDLNGLVNTDLISNLSPAPDSTLFPEGVDTDWIKPGRSVWCWLDGGERTVEGMKEFSRLAGQLGFEYNTVDAFWYRWTDEQIKDLVDYSAQDGVKIWLWRHGRDLRDPQKRKELFERCRRLGVVGLKLDAFSHESKEFVDLYQACLREAAENQLMLNIHGSNKPTGEVRSWPNEMTREGIRGLEYGRNQYEWATHNTTLPFTRLIAGAGDYTPVIFGERKLDTSWAHQIATALIFNSSVVIFAAHPQTILDHPAAEIIKDIPAVWDETIVLPCSEIGEIAAFARRCGNTWFLAVLNGNQERSIQFPLSFLGEGWYEASVITDRPADASAVKKERAFCRKNDSLTGHMRAGGGYVVRFQLKN